MKVRYKGTIYDIHLIIVRFDYDKVCILNPTKETVDTYINRYPQAPRYITPWFVDVGVKGVVIYFITTPKFLIASQEDKDYIPYNIDNPSIL